MSGNAKKDEIIAVPETDARACVESIGNHLKAATDYQEYESHSSG